MPRWLPWLLLLMLPCLRFPGALPGPRVVSADDHLSVHHAFQQSAGGRVRHPQLSDPALQFAALRGQVVRALKAGEAPLWNPDIWAGAPLLGDGQSSVGSPVTWLRLVLPEDWAQDLGVLWVLLWTGFGAALLTRRLGAGAWGACTAGLAAMTGPYTQVWLLHPHAATFAWLPWVLLSLERRAPVGLAMCTAGLLMGGHPETAAHCLIWVGLWVAVRRQWRTALLGMPIGLLLSAPILLPLGEEILRSASLAAHGGNRVEWGQLLSLVWPGWHGHPALETWTGPGIWSDGRLHPGLGILGLAVLGLLRRQRYTGWLWAAWAVCILAACAGLPGPANHARLGVMGAWFLAIAGGLCVTGLRARWRPAAALLVLATGLWACWPDQGSLPPEAHAPEPAPWTQSLRAELDCTSGDASADGCGRIIGLGWAIQPNTGSLAGLRDIRGYDLPVSWEAERLQGLLQTPLRRPWFQIDRPPAPELLAFLAVRAVATPSPLPGLAQLDLGQAPLVVHPVTERAPRAWLATGPTRAPDPDTAARLLVQQPSRARPPVVGLPGRWTSPGSVLPAAIQSDEPSRVVVSAQTPVRALLVLADAWHPGWTAVDASGTAHPILQVGGVIRGVVLEPGSHTIEFKFTPAGWRWGLLLGAAGLGLLCVLIALRRRPDTGTPSAPQDTRDSLD
jgi:hypothetical protein